MVCGMVYHYLVWTVKWIWVVIIIEFVECCDVYYHCLLIGFGVDGINFYFVYEVFWYVLYDDLFDLMEFDYWLVIDVYWVSVVKGILKVMGKMGIFML